MQQSIKWGADDGDERRGAYTPVLLDKAGELRALTSLRGSLEDVTPVLRIQGRPSTPLSRDALRGRVGQIADAIGPSKTFYLDFARLKPERELELRGKKFTTAELAYRYARLKQLDFVPVAWSNSSAWHLNDVGNAAAFDGRGAALRVPVIGTAATSGAELSKLLKRRAGDLGLPIEQIDLWLDVGFIPEDTEFSARRLTRLLSRCEAVGPWRRVFLAASSMPASLSEIKEGTAGPIVRREWLLWKDLPPEVRERLEFGDYGIQHPVPPGKGGRGMRANLRYTSGGVHFIVRGKGPWTDEGVRQYVGLCGKLVASSHFRGPGYSPGDSTFSRCAKGLLAPGAQDMWREAGTAHHIKNVLEQLAASPTSEFVQPG